MSPNKACPIILSDHPTPRLLLFHHPLAGVQLVKGTIEPGELPAQAALRELHEESGIATATVIRDLGCWNAEHEQQIWSFQLCQPHCALPAQWTHQTLDDHGHAFDFFWAAVDDLPLGECHPVFQRALQHLSSRCLAAQVPA
ncbi:DNA mismatch repair protein MutT [Pseudomonas sp. SDI]|uniref:NUDIX hydrolase n=1 Tax=Pseudomonas sp. SDI TaxID=2170734 RepID=UPI000DE5D85D|nr:NUDIX domain-containing protein [Pseudomonas sp. SDI]PWB35181.1 DNA mismatch repair protein MutT [Pseudomonas sp. SDI]